MHLILVLRSDFNHNPGGDVIQLRSTEAALKERGVKVQTVTHIEEANFSDVDAIQLFNLGRPHEIMPWLHVGLPVYVFTIWVDFYEMELKASNGIRRVMARAFGRFGLEYVKVCARWLKGQTRFPGWQYIFSGHRKSMQYVIDNANGLMASTENESKRLAHFFHIQKKIVVNPLGLPSLFFNQNVETGSDIVFGGYIEPRKNVLSLIKICNKRKWTLHIYGKASLQNQAYERKCRKEAGETIHFHGYVPQEVYAKALSKSRVVALPSWFETTGLAALEGAVMGKGVVVGNKGDTKDVFGPNASYVDPGSEQSIENGIEEQLTRDYQSDQRTYFSGHNFQSHCERLLNMYEQKT